MTAPSFCQDSPSAITPFDLRFGFLPKGKDAPCAIFSAKIFMGSFALGEYFYSRLL